MVSTSDEEKWKKSGKIIVILFTNEETENIFPVTGWWQSTVFNYSQHYFNVDEKEILMFY